MLERKTIQVDGVYDIETECWTRFVAGGLLTRNGYHCFTWRSEDDFVDLLLQCEGRFFAHNGGRYDALWFLGHVRRRGLKAICNGQGQRITNLRVGKLVLCDSFALVPMALSKGSQLGRVPKIETGFPCNCGEACGGYCSINRNMSVADMRKLLAYLEQDCRATLSMLDAVVDFCEANDLDLGYTIGGSSWASARRLLGLEHAQWSWGSRGQSPSTLYQFARGAYYGGRTQVFKPLAMRGWRYDINSAYPAALAQLALPTGVPLEQFGWKVGRSYRAGKEGLFRARVRIPECHVPPLPVRGKLRLVYPYGTAHGTWTGYELRYAESVGARIERIESGLVWSDSSVVFGSFCRKLWDLRDKAGPKTAWGTWIKWLANSLTGRLAIRPEAETIIVARGDSASVRFCPADWDCSRGRLHRSSSARCCEHQCTRRCGATLPLGGWGHAAGVFVRPRWQIADSAHVHWAAYLTSHARVELHRQLIDLGADEGWSAVYCDTDSCYSLTEREYRIGSGLGEWKAEGEFRGFEALAPKTYSYNPWPGPLVPDCKAKGIEDPGRNWWALRAGEGILSTKGVKGLKSAIREDEEFFVRKHMIRSLHSTEDVNGVRWYGDRWLGEDGYTHPTTMEGIAT